MHGILKSKTYTKIHKSKEKARDKEQWNLVVTEEEKNEMKSTTDVSRI